jgi:hypothetical protein
MQHDSSHARTPAWLVPSDFLFRLVAKRAKTGDPSATLDRFFCSQHVKDLRVIIRVALFAVIFVFAVGLLLSAEHEWQQLVSPDPPAKPPADLSGWPYVAVYFIHLPAAVLQRFLAFFGPVLVVFGGLVAWAYQAGGARLGVVDLFACEISTLCRVSTVLDTVSNLINKLDHPPVLRRVEAPAAPSNQFNSQEDYFPVFENNTKDLQSLEAKVVINITAFYTYMKAVRDAMRALALIPASLNEAAPNTPRHATARDVIYLLYLGLESGRNAIKDLVEFEPEEAERTIVVLISELVAYGFLRREFSNENDMRCKRLKLREPIYHQLIPPLCGIVERGFHRRRPADWEPAWLLLPELRKRYADAVPPEAAHPPKHHASASQHEEVPAQVPA